MNCFVVKKAEESREPSHDYTELKPELEWFLNQLMQIGHIDKSYIKDVLTKFASVVRSAHA